MNEITNHAELTVERVKEGKYLRNKILMQCFYWGLPVLILVVCALIEEITWAIPTIKAVNGITAIGIFFIPIWAFVCPKVVAPILSAYVNIEEKMDVSGGNLKLSKILGRRKEVEYVTVKIADMDVIHPLRECADEAKGLEKKADRVVRCVSTMNVEKDPDIYFAYCTRTYDPEVEKAKRKNQLVKINTDVDENGNKIDNSANLKTETVLMYFEATQKALNIFKFLNKNATIAVDVRR